MSCPAGPIHSRRESGNGDGSSHTNAIDPPIGLTEFGPGGRITRSLPKPHSHIRT